MKEWIFTNVYPVTVTHGQLYIKKNVPCMLKSFPPLSLFILTCMPFRLDPFPQLTEKALNSLLNARFLVFAVVVAKVTLDRLYKYAMVK